MKYGEPQFNIETESRDNYLYAKCESPDTNAGVLIGAFVQILPECRRLGYSKLLIEHISGGQLNTTDAFEAATGIVDLDVTGIKIAYVDHHPNHLESLQFGELVAINRGAFGKVFSNLDQAIEWLAGGDA